MAPVPPALPELFLYTRDGCHLCDEALAAIEGVFEERRHLARAVPRLHIVDIAADPALERLYRERIPVVTFGAEELELAIGPRRIARLLERVLDGVTAA